MKKRKTLEEIYSQHKKAIQLAILEILAIALFIVGYLISWNFLQKPLNNSQFELCEQVARDVYAQNGNVIVEAPKDFSVSMTATTIEVKPVNNLYRGKVIARLKNGELVMTREMETVEAVIFSIFQGVLLVALTIIIVNGACETYKKIKRKSVK